jgi:hypothetical protein
MKSYGYKDHNLAIRKWHKKRQPPEEPDLNQIRYAGADQ